MDKFELQKRIDENPDAKLRDIVENMMYDDIITLRIAPGSKLNINQISAAMGISRTPVSEAVASLMDRGFVTTHQGQGGCYVIDLNLVDMISLYQARSAIESEAAALCAGSADDEVVRRLNRLADAFKESAIKRDVRGMKDTDMPFHRMIVEHCGNPYLIQAYDNIRPKLTMYQASMLEFVAQDRNDDNPFNQSVIYNHISVASAIRMRMPELARQSMADHVSASLNYTTISGQMPDPFSILQRK